MTTIFGRLRFFRRKEGRPGTPSSTPTPPWSISRRDTWPEPIATSSRRLTIPYIFDAPQTYDSLEITEVTQADNGRVEILTRGTDRVEEDGSLIHYFEGSIAVLRFWNTVRPESELVDKMLFEVDASDSALVGHFRLAEGTGSTTSDATGSADTAVSAGRPAPGEPA